jgi:hypothetical protein
MSIMALPFQHAVSRLAPTQYIRPQENFQRRNMYRILSNSSSSTLAYHVMPRSIILSRRLPGSRGSVLPLPSAAPHAPEACDP